jgi:hypothetical protein
MPTTENSTVMGKINDLTEILAVLL